MAAAVAMAASPGRVTLNAFAHMPSLALIYERAVRLERTGADVCVRAWSLLGLFEQT